MIDKERIIRFIRAHGPVLPAQISKEISQNILMSSAVLSEMASNKEVKISSIKIGSSPLYYLEGQESQLQDFVGKLNPKDRQAYELLKNNKVIRDSSIEPMYRVSMRALKDFAIPLQVTFNEKKEIFWKWFLLSNSEAEPIIKSALGLVEKEAEKEKPIESDQDLFPAKADSGLVSAPASAESKVEAPDEHKEQPQEAIGEVGQKKPKSRESQPLSESREPLPAEGLVQQEKKELARKKPVSRPKDFKDKFMKVVDDFFGKNNIEVVSTEFVKKGEINCIVLVPTVIGKIEYFVKVKAKKSINDTDLNHAYLEGKDKGMQTLFLTNGDLTNKVKDLLNTRYRGLVFRKLSTNGS